jgi:putative Holliday junction resolvase
MAIDYGRKRSGVAVTDAMQIIAGGLETVPSGELVDYISAYAMREPVDMVIVGFPLQMNGEPSGIMPQVEAFVTHLRRTMPGLTVEYHDERFTSVMAHRAMIDGGLKRQKRQNKALADEISAVIILQSFMESNRNNTNI